MTEFQPRPGQSAAGYDVTRRLGTDYYQVFADISADDRAVWERAQSYVDEVGTQMQDAWDAATYPSTSSCAWASSTSSTTASTTPTSRGSPRWRQDSSTWRSRAATDRSAR
nr:hypothetical protein GCM10025699_01950 [Microbacterium flavescens]